MNNQKTIKPSTIIIGLIVLALLIEPLFSRDIYLDIGLLVFLLLAIALHVISPHVRDRLSGFEVTIELSLPILFAVFNLYSMDTAKLFTAAVFILSYLLPVRRIAFSKVVFQLFTILIALAVTSICREAGVSSVILQAVIFAAVYFAVAVLDFRDGLNIPYIQTLKNLAGIILPWILAAAASSANLSREYESLIWLSLAVGGAACVHTVLRLRNQLFASVRLVSRLASQSEMETEAVLYADEYVRETAALLGMPPHNADAAVLAVHLHEVGRAGMEEYSVEHIIETISAEKGEPLHAERAHQLLNRIRGLEVVSESLKLHHRYERRGMLRQERKKVSLVADLVAALTRFGELLAFNTEKIYTPRDAFKDLKKDSGWSLNPSVVRALRMVLLGRGIKRL